MALKKKTKQQPISAKELKFWLDGILEFQTSDWIPSKEQWNTIKDKIFSLEDENINVHTQWTENQPKTYQTEVKINSNNPQPTTAYSSQESQFMPGFPQMSEEEQKKRIKDIENGNNFIAGAPRPSINAQSFE